MGNEDQLKDNKKAIELTTANNNMKFCNNCGKTNKHEYKYCTKCRVAL